jgi:multiple sugar transport system substrate-binding protein
MKKFSRRHFVHASAGLATAALTGCGSNTHSFSPDSNSSAMPGGSGKIVQWYHEYDGRGV